MASDGNFYGTTAVGGTGHHGTVFQMTPAGVVTTLHAFNGYDGGYPEAELVEGVDGTLYGTTYQGGASYYSQYSGAGTIFKLTKAGAYTLLHSFDHNGATDEGGPTTGLIFGADGNLYGTTAGGGAYGDGAVYKITPSGSYSRFFSFNHHDGSAPLTVGMNPSSGLTLATDGNFYGVTLSGGGGYDIYQQSYCGSIYCLTPTGLYTNIHSFSGIENNDGSLPYGSLACNGTDFVLYGTTSAGGELNANSNYVASGTIFSIFLDGSNFKTLHTFYQGSQQHPLYQ